MTFVLRLNTQNTGGPAPAFAGVPAFARWENRCGWCEQSFRTAAELVAHVVKERCRCNGN